MERETEKGQRNQTNCRVRTDKDVQDRRKWKYLVLYHDRGEEQWWLINRMQ